MFISYNIKSAGYLARQVCEALESAGISCWYAERNAGDVFAGAAVRAIRECQVFVLILNQAAADSPHVLAEASLAFRRRFGETPLHMLPFRVEACELSDELSYYLGPVNIVDGRLLPDSLRVEALVERIARILGRSLEQERREKDRQRLEQERQEAERQRLEQERQILLRRLSHAHAIAAWGNHTVALNGDGAVTATGSKKDGQCNVQNWRNIVSVATGGTHAVGLQADGTVVAAGLNNRGQCRVRNWKNIVAIAAGTGHTVGLQEDGRVVAAGNNRFGRCDVQGWRNITAIAAGNDHTVGLKAVGTVVAVGNKEQYQGIEKWHDITAIAAGLRYTAGLQANGTVVTAGDASYIKAGDWRDITAIFGGQWVLAGLRTDGRVMITGSMDSVKLDAVRRWTGIAAVASGYNHVIGLKTDGTIVAKGLNLAGQCNVSDWRNVRVPSL